MSIVTSFGTQYGTGMVNGAKNSDTLSAVQTSSLANLDAAIQAFTTAALNASTTAADWNAIAFGQSAPWYSETQAEGYIDLGSFMNAVASAPGVSATLKTAAGNVSTALAAAIIAKTADSRQSSGLTVYVPPPGTTLNTSYFDPTNTDPSNLAAVFVNSTNWYNFLLAFQKNAPAQAVAPASFTGGGPNRSATDAFNLHDQIGPDNTYAGLSLAQGDGSNDEEWFSITLTATGVEGNAVTATYTPGGGTVDLTLYDQNSNQLGDSNTGTGQDSISLAGLPAGTYFISVESGNDEDVPEYTLGVNAPTPATLPTDYAGNNTSQASAYNLGTISAVAEFSGLTLQTGDTDWYQFNLAANPTPEDSGPSSLTIQGSSDQMLTAQVLNQEGTVLASASGSGTLNLNYPQVDAGSYFLNISGAAGAYALHFNPPLLTNGDLNLSPAPVGAGQSLTLDGSVEKLASSQTYTVQINWGDGSQQTTVNLAADSSDFEATHTYAKVWRLSHHRNGDDRIRPIRKWNHYRWG